MTGSRFRPGLLLRATLPFLSAILWVSTAAAARQAVVLAPLSLSDNTLESRRETLEKTVLEKLRDRFDVHAAAPGNTEDPAEAARRKSRAVGAGYIVTGSATRIGRSVTLDLSIAPSEAPAMARTVVATGTEETLSPPGPELTPLLRRLVTEATARLKLAFFGDDMAGSGENRRRLPAPAGTVVRSAAVPGAVVSTAFADIDRDGKREVVAALENGVFAYRVEGNDLVEEARLPEAPLGLFRVDTGDVRRSGVAQVIAVGFAGGKARSDVWEFDGRSFRRIAEGIPWFLRTADLGREGIVLVGQESDPESIFRGPVYRVTLPDAPGKPAVRGDVLPLPEGTGVYGFATLRYGPDRRLAVVRPDGRLLLLDPDGKRLGETLDAIAPAETSLVVERPGEAEKFAYLSPRLFPLDIDGDGRDELVVTNNLVASGAFFEGVKVFSDAEVLCFAQEEETLRLAWRTGRLKESARDAFVDFDPATRAMRIGIGTRDKGKLLDRAGGWRILWLK